MTDSMWNGRVVTSGTLWFLENTTYPRSDVACIHEVSINKPCKECKADDRSKG